MRISYFIRSKDEVGFISIGWIWVAAIATWLGNLILFQDSLAINNNYDVAQFYVVELFLPAVIGIIILSIVQKWINIDWINIIIEIFAIIIHMIAGIVVLKFQSFNGDTLLYISGWFMIYHKSIYMLLVMSEACLVFTSSTLYIQKLKENRIQGRVLFNNLTTAWFAIAVILLATLMIAIYSALGMCYLSWGVLIGLFSLINYKSEIMNEKILETTTSISTENHNKEIVNNQTQSDINLNREVASLFKGFSIGWVSFIIFFIIGFSWAINFFRVEDYNGEMGLSMYYTIDQQYAIGEIISTLTVFIILLTILKILLSSKITVQFNLYLSRKLERNIAFTAIILIVALWISFAIGRLILPIRAANIFIPWILCCISAWWIIAGIRKPNNINPGFGLWYAFGMLSLIAGIALSGDMSSDFSWELFVLLITICVGVIAFFYLFIGPKFLQYSPEKEMRKSKHRKEREIEKSKENAKIGQKRKLEFLKVGVFIFILCIPIFTITSVNANTDSFQILANVDNNCIFYLADPTTRISKDYQPQFGLSNYKNVNNTFTISAARNEYEAVQIIMRPIYQSEFSIYKVDFSGFTNNTNNIVIPATNFEAYLVEYIPELSNIIADKLVPFHPIATSSFTNLPIWMNFYVPSGTPAGLYNGTIRFTVDNKTDPNEWYPGQIISLNINLEVFNFTLPTTPTLKSNFGYWNEQKYFPEMMEIFESHRMMQWKFAHYPQATLFTNGSIHFINFTDFIEEIDAIHEYGTRTIGIHAGSYASMFPESDFIVNGVPYNATNYTQASSYNRTVAEYFQQFELFLKSQTYVDDFGEQKSWFEEFYINGHDEIQARPQAVIDKALAEYNWLKNVVNTTLPIMQTVMGEMDGKFEIVENVQIICLHTSGAEFPYITEWKNQGKEVWIYTTRGPRFASPSLSTSGMATQIRALGWQCYLYNYTHYLIWDVVTPFNARGGYGYQGWSGGTIFYSGGDFYYRSTRSELVREGFEDHDYFTLLNRSYTELKSNNPSDPRLNTAEDLLERINNLMTVYKPEMNYREYYRLRYEIGTLLGEISIIR